MFSSTVLEVAIGLVFCFASVALITSSIYEAISSWLDLRSKTLFTGIKDLLNANDPKNSDSKDSINQKLVLGIYNNALASPLGKGEATTINDIKIKPSYIDSKHFALAMIETIQSIPGDFGLCLILTFTVELDKKSTHESTKYDRRVPQPWRVSVSPTHQFRL